MAGETRRGIVGLLVLGAIFAVYSLGKNPQPSVSGPALTTQPAPQAAPQAVVNDDVPIAPIEDNAVISDELKGKIKMTNAAVLLVRGATFKCDSVSGLRPFVFSTGFALTCNKFRYSYSIEDRGGHWIVTVE
jgi:hypothetical protein